MIRVHGIDVLDTPQELLDPARTAVVVIDMQNEIVSNGGGYAKHGYDVSPIQAIVPTIGRLLDAARQCEIPVIYTEFVHRDRFGACLMDGPNTFLHRRAEWISDVTEGTWAAATVDELAPRPGETVLAKSRASALCHTGLEGLLKDRGIDCVLLVGCLSDGCVLKTAIDMTHHGFYAMVVSDAVASMNPESHRLGLDYLALKVPIFTSAEVLAVWGG
ncbi:MAG TPA: isochorismatase family cysteine hydrolase [Planctomycetaceae bacterium]|nr:isochorismatase family cysteine hydrolase [Planctomycetaceae bacterium]